MITKNSGKLKNILKKSETLTQMIVNKKIYNTLKPYACSCVFHNLFTFANFAFRPLPLFYALAKEEYKDYLKSTKVRGYVFQCFISIGNTLMLLSNVLKWVTKKGKKWLFYKNLWCCPILGCLIKQCIFISQWYSH